jgi:hypothetical protein
MILAIFKASDLGPVDRRRGRAADALADLLDSLPSLVQARAVGDGRFIRS